MNDTLAKRFNETAASISAKPAIIYKKSDGWSDISYGELNNTIGSLRAFLSKEGIVKNDKVAFSLKNRPEWPELFFAIISTGAIAVPINPDAQIEEVVRIINDSEARLVFLGNESARMESEITKGCAVVNKVISVDGAGFIRDTVGGKDLNIDAELQSDDIACILYTSGTTDEPKGVMLSHKNLLSNIESIEKLRFIKNDDRILSVLPLHHIYPLTVSMLMPLILGGTIIYPEAIHGEALSEAMSRTNPTLFIAVPQILYILHQKIKDKLASIPALFRGVLGALTGLLYGLNNKTGINLSRYLYKSIHRRFGNSMRFLVSGGAKLDKDVQTDFMRFGFTVLEGYGLTETSPILTLNATGRVKIGSAGFALPDVKIRIDNKDENGVGEVAASGPNIMKGYYKRPDLTQEVIKDGWFYTGDLGYLDKDGYLFLTGRSKDVIVLSSGLKIYPDEVERIYGARSVIKELCIFEAPAKIGMEHNKALWAVVVPDLDVFRKHGEGNIRELIKASFDRAQASLPPHKRIVGFVVTLEPLPRTLLGKLKRFLIKEKYIPKILEESAAVMKGPKTISEEDKKLLDDDATKKIMAYLKTYTRLERDVTPQDSLELDLGIDSLGRIELAASLEKLFNIKMKDETVGGAFIVRELIRNLKSIIDANSGIEENPGAFKQETADASDRWLRILEVSPDEENLKKIDLKPGIISRIGYSILIGVLFLIFKLFFRLKIEGAHNIPRKGPYIIYANHVSFFDGMLIGVSMPRYAKYDIFFLSFRIYFDAPVLRNLIKLCRIIPIDFFSHLAESLRSIYYVIKNGKNICMFPEGRISLDGEMKGFKKGFGIIVKETKSTVVPVSIEGAHEAWPLSRKFPRPHPIKVKIGKPIEYEKLAGEAANISGKDEYDALNIAAREHVLKLKGEIRV